MPSRWPNRLYPPVVLFVDDEKVLAQAFADDLIEHYGYEVVPCFSARDALGRANQYGDLVDVIIMDVRLGIDDGVQVAEMMLKRCTHAKVVYVSGDPSALDGLPGYCLPKPYRVQDLDRALRVLISGNGC